MTKPSDHDAYMAAAPEPLRPLLAKPRTQLSDALPRAEEVMMYGMPGYRHEGKLVAGYAAFSKSCGLYVDPGAIADHANELCALKLKATKTGVTFSVSQPIPEELIKKLAVSSYRKKSA